MKTCLYVMNGGIEGYGFVGWLCIIGETIYRSDGEFDFNVLFGREDDIWDDWMDYVVGDYLICD